MAGSVNKVILVGNLGKDPEGRSTQGGTRIVNFSVATSESWKDKSSGEKKERTEWHNVVIFNDKLGEIAEKYLRKGSKVYVEGALQTRKWTDNSGQDRYTTEVVLKAYQGTIVLLDSGGGKGGSRQDDDRGGGGGRQASGGGGSRDDDLSDDIQFAINDLDRDIMLARNRKPRYFEA